MAKEKEESSIVGNAVERKKRNKQMEKENLFSQVGDQIKSDFYLGNVNVVKQVLVFGVQNVVSSLKEAHPDPRKTKNDIKAESKRLGSIFLGFSKNFTAIPKWNAPGGVDRFVKKHMNFEEGRGTEIMQHYFADFFMKVLGVMEEVEAGEIDQVDVSSYMDNLTEETALLLLGVSPAQQMILATE